MGALRIAVVGMGGIGSTFAFHLARVGKHEVTVVARPGSPRLAQLQRDRAIVDVKGERAEVLVLDALDETVPYDLVIVTLLAHQVSAVVPALQRSAAKSVQMMFNNFDPERLREALGAEKCTFGMPFVQATITPEGRLKAKVGAPGQKTLMAEQRFVEVFQGAGLPAVREPEMLLWLRCHTPMCVAFESVSVAGVRRGRGASFAEAMTLARGVKEGFALIRGLGFRIYPASKSRFDLAPTFFLGTVLWGMSRIKSFRELLATGLGECRALVDTMLAASPAAGAGLDPERIRAMKP